MKNVGVVIVNYNDSINAIKLYESLKEMDLIKEIVIVDNNSKDGFRKELESYQSNKLHIIFNKDNKGYAYALNIGAKYLNKKYDNLNIIFSNTDIVVSSHESISVLNELIDEEHKAAMLKVKESDTYNSGWKLTSSFVDLICNIPFINKLYKNKFIYYKDNYFNKNIIDIDVVYGCFFIVDGETLKEINYFDDQTFLYFEENILSRKLERINKKCSINTTYYVTHAHNKTIGTNISRYNKYKIYKKSQFYYEKNYNKANIVEMFFFKLFYYIRLFILKITCLVHK